MTNDEFENKFLEDHGEIMTLEEVAKVYRYSSVAALRVARSRNKLPVSLYRFAGQRRLYAKTREVIESLRNMEKARD